jgi:pimeloyl-ACP methyl ester carboxylesterase
MSTAVSSDGTTIAYESAGSGPALILVDGALCHREFGGARKLSELLQPHFTVYIYDRRGRGQSGDTAPYAIDREVDDIAALVEAAGGSAYVYGISSGAALALDAANRIPGITKVATYEPPFVVDPSGNVVPDDFLPGLEQVVAEDRRSEAVKRFMRLVGAPRIAIAAMRLMPAWKKLKQVAHTLPYDLTILDGLGKGRPLPADRWTSVSVPTLAIAGGKSPEWMRQGSKALAALLPDAEYRTLEGQTHMVKPKVLAPVLIGFFGSQAERNDHQPEAAAA